MIARNIIANVGVGAWTVLLNLAAVRYQTHLLGVACFGLLSVLATLQVLSTVLDCGMGLTVIREVAADQSLEHRASHGLIRTLLGFYCAVGSALALAMILCATWLPDHLFRLGTIPRSEAVEAIRYMAVIFALSWPVALLNNCLAGLQRLDILNRLRFITSTLRVVGGIVVLVLDPSLQPFLAWQLLIGVIEVILVAWTVRSLLPGLSLLPTVAIAVVKRVWRFSLAVNIITIQSVLLTQADRLILGHRSIEEAGYYTAAYRLALGISLIQGFITSAMMPSFSATSLPEQREARLDRYAKANQVLVYISALPAVLLMMFSHAVLALIVGPEVAMRSSAMLSWLALGFLASVVAAIPYTMAMASGLERIPLLLNCVLLVPYLASLTLLIHVDGGRGAALAWLGLNLLYVLLLIPRIQIHVLGTYGWRWQARNTLPFIAVAALSFTLARLLTDLLGLRNPIAVLGMAALAACAFLIGGFACFDAGLRRLTIIMAQRFLPASLRPKDPQSS